MNHLAVLVSGNGTNLQAIIDACDAGRGSESGPRCASTLPDTRVSVVVSNRKAAYALKRAERHGIPTIYHPFLPYRVAGRSRNDYDSDLVERLSSYPVDLVIMSGWMHVFTMDFLRRYPGRVFNIHPALPGVFPGTHVIERAYEAFHRGEIDHTGVMVHRVPDEGVDIGPVVLQRAVPIYPTDTLEELEARMHCVEHELYVEAIALELGLGPMKPGSCQ